MRDIQNLVQTHPELNAQLDQIRREMMEGSGSGDTPMVDPMDQIQSNIQMDLDEFASQVSPPEEGDGRSPLNIILP